MELLSRKGADVFVPPGRYRELEARLADRAAELSEAPAVVLACFDPATRLLPFVMYDRWIFPAGTRTVAGALHQAGFKRTRAVFQLWNPHFRPSQAQIDNRPVQMLLVSSMQIHMGRAAEAIADAHRLGEDRPLILAGGSGGIHEPYHHWAPGRPAPDVVCTGEAFVLLDLLNVLVEFRGKNETMRTAFERARQAGALDAVPGLVYRHRHSTVEQPVLVDTGLQRLVQHLDELPDEVVGLRLLEPPHRGKGLSAAPLADRQVGRRVRVASLMLTQGCKFNCSYCPIPAMQQRTWRFRSPEGVARQIRSVHETFGIRDFFGADDNFFNKRQTVEEIMTVLARTKTADGSPLHRHAHWATEATQFDTFKNRDLLPLGRQAGLRGIWFGIEDLTAELVNKGQKPEVTIELFKLMHRHKIAPMAMMMYHEGQPFNTPNSLYGLYNQVDFLRKAGALTVQVTVHFPAVGTRELEGAYDSGKVLKGLGAYELPDSVKDGNHVLVAGSEPSWLRQLKMLGGYAAFYNPLNLFRTFRAGRSPLRNKAMVYQILGFMGLVWTAVRILPYVARLLWGKPRYHTAPPPVSVVPVVQVAGVQPRLPGDALPQPDQRQAA